VAGGWQGIVLPVAMPHKDGRDGPCFRRQVEADTPRELFAASVTGGISPYDVAADGQRFRC